MHGRDLAPERVIFDYGTINSDGTFNKVGHTNIFLIDGIRNNRKNPNMRKGKEPQFSKSKINLTCKSKKTWDRYQINFVLVDGEVVFSYSACRNKKNQDTEASKTFAES